ncbi:MAG: hypothetical protein Ct9H300mP13_5000 [Gammaproteobacteria bacterium]|nr:MAG: hypothetical protein Ct9H300mP13_5000 [Gammaproteobacteria bacterium]
MLEFFKEVSTVVSPRLVESRFSGYLCDVGTGKVASNLGWGVVPVFLKSMRGRGSGRRYRCDAREASGPKWKRFSHTVGCEPWMIFKDGKNPKARLISSSSFINLIITESTSQKVPIHFFPIRKSVQNDPKYLATPDLGTWKFWVDAQKTLLATTIPNRCL